MLIIFTACLTTEIRSDLPTTQQITPQNAESEAKIEPASTNSNNSIGESESTSKPTQNGNIEAPENISSASTSPPFVLPDIQQTLAGTGLTPNLKLDQAINETLEFISLKNTKKQSAVKQSCGPHPETYPALNVETFPCFLHWIAQNNLTTTKATKSNKKRKRRSPKLPTDFGRLANADLMTIKNYAPPKSLTVIRDFSAFLTQQEVPCKYSTAIAIMTLNAESFLAEERGYETLNTLYEVGEECLGSESPYSEIIHQRIALYRLQKGFITDATSALEKALNYAGDESYRTLFWLGLLKHLGLASIERNSPHPWTQLFERHPLELHTIVAHHLLGQDPLTNLEKNKSTQWPEIRYPFVTTTDVIGFFHHLFLARKQPKEIHLWNRFLLRHHATLPAETLIWLAHGSATRGDHFTSISLITRAQKLQPSSISLATLKVYFPTPYLQLILAEAKHVDPFILFGLIRQESTFQPTARSSAGARGLMQILPRTARKIQKKTRIKDLYQPERNIPIGSRFLANLASRFGNLQVDALAGYNAGPGRLQQWHLRSDPASTLLFADLIPFRETRGYVAKVLRNAYWYGRLYTHNEVGNKSKLFLAHKQALWRSPFLDAALEPTTQSIKIIEDFVIPKALIPNAETVAIR